MESVSRTRLLDAALELLGRSGAAGLKVRAVEEAAELPHGSVRHHFGDRAGLVGGLFERLAERELGQVDGSAVTALEHWLGPGRILTLARYELFLMAARDPTLRPPLIKARDRFVTAAERSVGPSAAPTVVAALDGIILDRLVRGDTDRTRLAVAVSRILGG